MRVPCKGNGSVPHVEVIDDAMAQVLRLKTGAERLRIASGMYAFARKALLAHIRTQHPQWTEGEVRRETSRRLSHGAI